MDTTIENHEMLFRTKKTKLTKDTCFVTDHEANQNPKSIQNNKHNKKTKK